MIKPNARIKKIFSFAIKLVLALLTFGVIYVEIFRKDRFKSILEEYSTLSTSPSTFYLLLAVLVLMLTNWSIEALKWKLLIAPFEQLGFLRSLKAVLSGVSISVFTPNRIGEYAGRVFHLEKADKIDAIISTMIGSTSQLMITVLTGTVSYTVFIINRYEMPAYEQYIILFLGVIACVALTFLFLNLDLLYRLLDRVPFLHRYQSHIKTLASYPAGELTELLLLSLLRFAVFTAQYILLLYLFRVYIPWYHATMLISIVFLVQALIPTFTLLELGIRGITASYYFSDYTSNLAGVTFASYSLWLVNLMVPSVIGLWFIFGLKFFDRDA